VSGELREDRLEIDLPIAWRSKPTGPLDPRLKAAVGARLSVRSKFRVLHVEHLDALVVMVDVGEVVERLQHKMTWIVHDVAALVAPDALEKHLERQTIVKILRGMDLVTKVDAVLVKEVKNRPPATRELIKAVVD